MPEKLSAEVRLLSDILDTVRASRDEGKQLGVRLDRIEQSQETIAHEMGELQKEFVRFEGVPSLVTEVTEIKLWIAGVRGSVSKIAQHEKWIQNMTGRLAVWAVIGGLVGGLLMAGVSWAIKTSFEASTSHQHPVSTAPPGSPP